MTGRSGAETFARHDGNCMRVKQGVRETCTAEAGGSYIQHQVHRTLRGQQTDGILPIQHLHGQGTSSAERFGDL